MSPAVVEDRLTLGSTIAGVFLLAVVAMTVAGQPWQYVSGPAVAIVQILAAVLTLGLGVGTLWLAHRV
ncbi:MAG: hypothetical protein ABEJ35_06040 [Halobacteriaceae archaeon]